MDARASNKNVHPVIFILNNIFPEPSRQGECIPPERMANLVARYQQALSSILDSPLNKSGMVDMIYINFGRRGCYQVSNSLDVPSLLRFENLLSELFDTRMFLTPGSDEVLCSRVKGGMQRILKDLQPMYPLYIGGFSGSRHPISISEYLPQLEDDFPFVFVVGDLYDKQIASCIDAVSVSKYELEAHVILSRITALLERRWNIR